ncbi:MAG: AarF/ABC1/UbiB kinase family protein, partial [Sphingomonas sp.]|nr:AarF/ABC1/UbiB kinase family protein [Sphingomonas sp.]
RMTGMMPKEIDIAPLLVEAKRQLHEEADYVREGAQMARFRALLADDPGFVVPLLDEEFTSGQVLAMSFIEGTAIENLVDAPQEERDRVMSALIRLVLRELFEFGLMQTDPNFANFRYQRDTGKLVLLDFGATRDVTPKTAAGYRGLLSAGLDGDRDAVAAAAVVAGFLGDQTLERHPVLIGQMIDIIIAEMNRPGHFDFGDRAFVGALKDQGMAIGQDRGAWHMPPIEMLFAQRKISGTALLAARLKAKVAVREMVERYRA